MKRRILISCLTISFFCIFARETSQAQTKAEDVVKLIQLKDPKILSEEAFSGFLRSIRVQANLQIKDSIKRAEYLDSLSKEVVAATELIMENDLPKIYDSLYTHDEIKEMIRFFQSSTGKKFLHTQADINALIESRVNIGLPGLQQNFRDQLRQARIKRNPILDSLTDARLLSGPISKDAIWTFKFGDSLTGFENKIEALVKKGTLKKVVQDKNTFITVHDGDLLRQGKWKILPKFSEDSLTEIRLEINIPGELSKEKPISVYEIKAEFEKKYGAPDVADTVINSNGSGVFKYYWIRGNQKISIVSNRLGRRLEAYVINVYFSDTRREKFQGGRIH